MMGVPLSGSTYIYGENIYAIHSTQRSKRTLNNKSKYIIHQCVRESVAMGGSLIVNVCTLLNPLDLCKKRSTRWYKKR